MDNFDLKKYLAEGIAISNDPSFIKAKRGLKQIFQQMLSGELSGKEANDQISDFTFGQGSMGVYPDSNTLFLRQFGMGGGDFNDYVIGKFENGGFTPASQPKNKTALKVWNYLSNLKLAEGKLLKESTRGQFGKIDKSGKITSVYTHSDSQPSRIRPLIKNYYNQGQGIDTILRRGDNSALEKDAGNMSFYNAKDLGHSGDIEDIQKYVEVVKNRGTEYIYLFDERDSKWYMFDVYGDNELYPMGGMVVKDDEYDAISEAFNPFLDTEEGGYMREYIDDAAEEEGLDLDYRNEFDEAFDSALTKLKKDHPELDFEAIKDNKESFFQ